MTMTSEERREVAESLREQLRHMRKNSCYAEDTNVVDCGNSAYRNIAWSVEPYGNFEKGNYVHIVERLADLIDPQERTCHNVSDYKFGNFRCSECGCFWPNYFNEEHNFCPGCGARITGGGRW